MKVPIDEVVFDFQMIQEVRTIEHGAIVYGLFIEGARWDGKREVLEEPFDKQLFAECPMIYLRPNKLDEIKNYKHY